MRPLPSALPAAVAQSQGCARPQVRPGVGSLLPRGGTRSGFPEGPGRWRRERDSLACLRQARAGERARGLPRLWRAHKCAGGAQAPTGSGERGIPWPAYGRHGQANAPEACPAFGERTSAPEAHKPPRAAEREGFEPPSPPHQRATRFRVVRLRPARPSLAVRGHEAASFLAWFALRGRPRYLLSTTFFDKSCSLRETLAPARGSRFLAFGRRPSLAR